MYDGQLELEYTCVCCHRNIYPRRLSGGYCSGCILGDMTPEELAAEYREHQEHQEDYCARYLYDYARDVVRGKRTVKEAARACCADLSEMEEVVAEMLRDEEESDRAWREYLWGACVDALPPPPSYAHIHRALARGVAHKRKQEKA